MTRLLGAIALCCTLGACRCATGVASTGDANLRATPPSLEFGRSYLTQVVTREVSVVNENRAPAAITALAGGAFHVVPASAVISGGDELRLLVSFAPQEAGAAGATLTVADERGALSVALSGEGLAVPTCEAAAACQSSAFDFDAGACFTAAVPDGVDCTNSSACFLQATCRGGQCVGLFTTCDDYDECTVDACGAQGCVHLARQCDVTNPCQVAVCDPHLGCQQEAVGDGTPCGPRTCAQAFICLNGRCEARPTPNARLNCTYSEVVANQRSTCALTLGGAVKCWGNDAWRATEVPAFAGTHGLAMDPVLAGILPDGGVLLDGPRGFSRAARAIDVNYETSGEVNLCALLDDQTIECKTWGLDWSDAGLIFDGGDGAALALFGSSACVLRFDGGVECRDLRTLASWTAPLPPMAQLASNVDLGLFGRDAFGRVSTTGNWPGIQAGLPLSLGLDGGFVSAGACGGFGDLWKVVCGADRLGTLECHGLTPVGLGTSDAGLADEVWTEGLPGPLHHLTTKAVHPGHLCLLDGHDELWCLGDNSHGQLGERSPRPPGVVEVPLPSPALALSVESDWSGTTVAVDGGLLHFSLAESTTYPYPVRYELPPGVEARLLSSPYQVTLLVDVDGGAWFSGTYNPAFVSWLPVPLPGPVTAVEGRRALAAGHAWEVSLPTRPVDLGPAVGISGWCVLHDDAGIDCDGAVHIPLAARRLGRFADPGQGCAADLSGSTRCWSGAYDVDGGVTFSLTTIVGARLFPRSVVGSASRGCLLAGRNGVQCWGDNRDGILGQDTPVTSASAVDLSFAEPIRSIAVAQGLGPDHACALAESGRLFCWGDNHNGQLGRLPLLFSKHLVKVE